MSIIKKSYDVIISGAGPVGSIAALALSKTPYIQNILIIEKYKPKLALT
jgi:2-polyprenyl-6-methoxyphenol hydroxylase-like FAD-dependent oxidoreductase